MITVWTLQRGCICEKLDAANEQRSLERDLEIQRERDPALTIEQWWMEEGRRCGYVKRKPKKEIA
jgi:hypothetical protein